MLGDHSKCIRVFLNLGKQLYVSPDVIICAVGAAKAKLHSAEFVQEPISQFRSSDLVQVNRGCAFGRNATFSSGFGHRISWHAEASDNDSTLLIDIDPHGFDCRS